MSILVDTHVLIYALRSPKKQDPQELKDFGTAAKWVLDNNQDIYISAITYFEILRGLRPNEEKALADLQSKLRIEAVTVGIVDEANRLLRERGQAEGVCRRCLGAKNESACKDCKKSISRQQKLNDALIVATAVSRPEIVLGYSQDGGVLDLAKLSTTKFEQLPNPHGPLFDAKKKRARSPE